MNARELKIGSLTALATCLLFSSGFLVVFTPFPIFFASAVYGKGVRRVAIFSAAIMAVLLYMGFLPAAGSVSEKWAFMDIVLLLPGMGLVKTEGTKIAQYFGLFYFFYFILFGYFFSEGFFREWSVVRWFAVSTVGTFVFASLAAALPTAMGFSVIDGVRTYMSQTLSELIEAQKSAGVENTRLMIMQQYTSEIVQFAVNIIPSVLFVTGLVIAAANQFLARWMIRVPKIIAQFGEITAFSLPHQMVWIVIGIGAAFFADAYFIHSTVLSIVLTNGLIVFGALYFMQGLLIVGHFTKKMRVRWMKGVLYLSIFLFMQFTAPLIAIVGFTDLWIDFRRLMVKEKKKKLPGIFPPP